MSKSTQVKRTKANEDAEKQAPAKNTADKFSQHKAETNPTPATGTEGKRLNSGSFFTRLASSFAVLSAIVSLVGYGVISGMVLTFGHSQDTLINSGFDLITMVWPAVFVFITSLNSVLSFDLLISLWEKGKVTVCAFAATIFLLQVVLLWLRPWQVDASAFRQKLRGFSTKKRSFFASVCLAAPGAVLFGAGFFAIQVTGAFIAISLLCLAIFFPSLGYVSGAAYTQKYVVEPKRCASASGRTTRLERDTPKSKNQMQEYGADCVLVHSLDPSKPFFRAGRTVLSSSSFILIWDSESGGAHRIPLSGMGVSSIGEESFQQMHQLLANYSSSCLSLTGDGEALVRRIDQVANDACKLGQRSRER